MSTGNGVGNFENFAISAWVFCYFTDSYAFFSGKANAICHKNLKRIWLNQKTLKKLKFWKFLASWFWNFESFLLPQIIQMKINQNCIKFLVGFRSTAKNECNRDLSLPFEPIWICIISSKTVLDGELGKGDLEHAPSVHKLAF